MMIPTVGDDEYDFMREYFNALQPVAIALKSLESSQIPFGLYLPTLFGLRKSFRDVKMNESKWKYCLPLMDTLQAGFEKRFQKVLDIFDEDANNVPLFIAMVSNPMFKLAVAAKKAQTQYVQRTCS